MARNPKEPPRRYTVLRDSNEPEGHGWVYPESDACAGTVVRNLYTADYSLDGYYDQKLFVIERKSAPGELAGNLTQKEKWDDFRQELDRLDEFRHPFVVCEFPLKLVQSYPRGSGIPPRAWGKVRVSGGYLMKRLQEVWLAHPRVQWVFCDGPDAAREVAAGLFKRVVEHVPAG